MNILELKDVKIVNSLSFKTENITFSVKKGENICVVGPSGCGKTTILRSIAGFVNIVDGEINYNGNLISTSTFHVPPENRRIGMVFQEPSLFPHLTIIQNIQAGLLKYDKSDTEQNKIIYDLISRMNLNNLLTKYPHEVSGGEQQRTALIRSIVSKPNLLLMDEPFSSLDFELREKLCDELKSILAFYNISSIMVTHDQNDAFAFGDRIIVLNKGRIIQNDNPYNVYHKPKTRFVADFIGSGCFIKGNIISENQLKTEILTFKLDNQFANLIGSNVDVLIRPDDVIHEKGSKIKAVITKKTFKGAEIMYSLKLANSLEILGLFPSHLNFDIGEQIGVKLEVDHLVAFRSLDDYDERVI